MHTAIMRLAQKSFYLHLNLMDIDVLIMLLQVKREIYGTNTEYCLQLATLSHVA